MNAQAKNRALAGQIAETLNPGSLANGWHPMGRELTEHARTLRRAQMTLHRWAEEMCNGTIQREGEQGDGKPFRVVESSTMRNPDQWIRRTYPVPDREAGALRRVAKVCKEAGLYFFHQTDCRGCALFVAAFPLDHSNYDRGVACL